MNHPLIERPYTRVEVGIPRAKAILAEDGRITGVRTSDVSHARRLASRMRAGQACLAPNGAGDGNELPCGGVRKSGQRRENGPEGPL